MPSIDTLVQDIYDVLDPENHHVVDEDNVQRTGELFKELLRNALVVKERGDVLRFSSLGKKDRQLWYDKNNEDREKFRPQTILKFQYGHVIELFLLFLAREAGHEVSDEQREVSIDGVKGHLDAVIDGTVVDVKSASPYGFKKFADGSLNENDPFGYMQQVSGYASEVTPETGGAFLAADKVHGDVALLKVDPDTVRAYDTPARVQHLKSVLEEDTPPPRCYAPIPEGKSGNMKVDTGCSYCQHLTKCWSDANGGRGLRKFISSKGPVFFTHIEREPKMFEAIG